MKKTIQNLFLMLSLLFQTTFSFAQITLDIDAGQRGTTIGPIHYGIFFEEINHAGDGGLYAELIQNRSFEDNATWYDKWWPIDGTSATLVSDGLLNEVQTRALQLTLTAAGDGVRNEGFWGINSVSGRTYKFSFWAKSESGYDGQLTVRLEKEDGTS
ncbi:MAG: carbohydrate binding domain-containing protein, partial [Paraprevotella sp.]|nr:carbohydrate binding domain-containing protein [Paraprevotella sp.]